MKTNDDTTYTIKKIDHCLYYSKQVWNKSSKPHYFMELNGTKKGTIKKTPQEE
jgi:hypothetical protein